MMIKFLWKPFAIYGVLLLIYNSMSLTTVTASKFITQKILMPGVKPHKPDQYLCTAKPVKPNVAYIVQMKAEAESNKAHHILLFGCSSYDIPGDHWDCGEGFDCPNMKILFAWAKNAPPTKLPEEVGFRIGSYNNINYLVLQVHYALPLNEIDNSGLVLQMTFQPQKYIAGIYLLLASSTVIPPHKEKTYGEINCKSRLNVPIHAFAYRVHAHKLGVVVSGYRVSRAGNSNRVYTEIAKGNPQWPQAFYPMTELFTIRPDDVLAARCTFNSTAIDTVTTIGSTTNDEMCNLYIMYYTEFARGKDFCECLDIEYPDIVSEMPADSDIPLPRNLLLEEQAVSGHVDHITHGDATENGKLLNSSVESAMMLPNKKGHKANSTNAANGEEYSDFDDAGKSPGDIQGSYNYYDVSRGHIHHSASSTPIVDSKHKEIINGTAEGKGLLDWFTFTQHSSLYDVVNDWPKLDFELGQVTSLAFDSSGNIVLFHRGSAIWGFSTFTLNDVYAGDHNSPISTDTVITIDRTTGKVLKFWGKNMFFMPHGLHVDSDDNLWITDVALHQVFKFPSNGNTQPLITLGERFYPGNDNDHFCKPSSVVVTKSGEFFVADGYCNSRIMKYSAKGELLLQWGQATSSILGFKYGSPSPYAFDIPHDLALAEDKGLIFVADRENGRIQCFHLFNGTFYGQVVDSQFGGRLFAVAYAPVNGGTLYAVNGPTANVWRSNVKGFVIQLSTLKIIGTFSPSAKAMSNPHDIIATADGNTLYVAEIGPNRVIQFITGEQGDARQNTGLNLNNKLVLNVSKTQSSSNDTLKQIVEAVHLDHTDDGKAVKEKSEDHTGVFGSASFSASMIIMALLAVPVLLMIVIAAVIRFKKRGKFHNYTVGHVKGWMTGYKTPDSDRFVIGNLLKNRHKGFDRVSMEDSDVDGGESDSDVEEYTVSAQKA